MHALLHYLRRIAPFPDQNPTTDGQLLERFLARREEAAFEELVRRHGTMVLGVCRRALSNEHEVEDAFQATFLVLVRKAASIRPPDLVGHWLYGVARKTAVRARARAAQRQAKEQAMPPPMDARDSVWNDVFPLLDQEITGLPERYRIPVVLCDLEGRSRKEVAKILGCAEGTLSSRLARARALLGRRLSHRGVTLAGTELPALVAIHGVPASIPSHLLLSTTKAALLVAAQSPTAAACLSLEAIALTEGVVRTMFFAKLKTVAVQWTLAALVITAGGWVYQAQSGKGNPADPEQDRGRSQPAWVDPPGDALVLADEPQPESPGVPSDAAQRLKEFEAKTETIRRRADAEIEALREKLLPELEALLDVYTKAGKLDEAVVIRDRIRLLKAASQQARDRIAHAKEKTRNLLVNGSFEEGPPMAEDGYHVVPLQLGSTAIKGWVVTRLGGGVNDYTYLQPFEGKRLGFVVNGGAISQTFKTRSRQKYRVSFWLAGDAISDHGEKRLRVSAAGKHAEFTFDTRGRTRQDMGWVRKTWEFTAESDETTLEFSCLSEGNFGVALDDVVVVAADA